MIVFHRSILLKNTLINVKNCDKKPIWKNILAIIAKLFFYDPFFLYKKIHSIINVKPVICIWKYMMHAKKSYGRNRGIRLYRKKAVRVPS